MGTGTRAISTLSLSLSLSLSLCLSILNGHFPGEPGSAGVY